MHLFYDPSIDFQSKLHTLSEQESRHACKVLRLQAGDPISMLNGKGMEFIGEIVEAHPKRCAVKINSTEVQEKENYGIHIAIAPTKIMDRMEWFLEKATEIGVTAITPLLCSNSERKQVKEERLEKILVSAMKQSKRLFLPTLHPMTDFQTFIGKYPRGLIAHCYEGEKQTISQVIEPLNFPLLIGPEGDFSMQEVELAMKAGYKTITLGTNRLRTETAGLYAVMQSKLKLEPLFNTI
jgi:16S rRNA (uracil1498-N3)-methyltransferase